MLAVALLTGCVAPALDSGAFQHNALEALDSGVSQTRTAALGVQNLLDQRVPKPYADTVVTDMEEAIGPVQDSFGSVDPPTPADERLRDDVSGLLSDADDALAQARIALRKDDEPAMRQSVRTLRAVADRMQRESGRLG
ncbi:hypothetical protein GCM10009740_33100 [Terrabacter terrae]|uniref:Uncharacterized protein n=1 Tax=Terrabacter terrae TaxID=318434 RepID=A0ABP5G3B2_9MICO